MHGSTAILVHKLEGFNPAISLPADLSVDPLLIRGYSCANSVAAHGVHDRRCRRDYKCDHYHGKSAIITGRLVYSGSQRDYVDPPGRDTFRGRISPTEGQARRDKPSHVQAYAVAWTTPFRVDCHVTYLRPGFGFDESYCSAECGPTKPSPYLTLESQPRR